MDIKIDNIDDVKKLLVGEHESQNKITVGYDGVNKDESVVRQIGDKWFDSDGNEWGTEKWI